MQLSLRALNLNIFVEDHVSGEVMIVILHFKLMYAHWSIER